jgi:hypothetical protein
MSAISRVTSGVRTFASNPVERRAYLARLKWLMAGSQGVQAWSLEYRSGLTGRFEVAVDRLAPDPEYVRTCPPGCGANSKLSHLYEQRFAYRIADTITSTATGATLACGNEEPPFFVRESISWPFESILSHGLEIPEASQVAEQITGTSVVFPTNPNYYHWLIEELPLVLRARALEPTASFLAYADGITARHRLVAEILNLRLRPSPLVVQCAEQLLPGRASDSWFIHPSDAQALHSFGALVAPIPAEGSKRIYVSRKHSRRALPQEELLEGLLASRGFRILHLESMPWQEQVAAFRAAELVVGPHGAGLANLVFSAPGATLIEFTNGQIYNRCFEWISHVTEGTYIAIDSDAFPNSSDPHRLLECIQRAYPEL